MSWALFAFLNSVFLAVNGLLIKLLSDRVSLPIRLIAVYAIGLATAVIMLWMDKRAGKTILVSSSDLPLIILMGLTAVLAFLAYQIMFMRGAPLSLGNAVTRVGTILLSVVLGILVFNEVISVKSATGIVLSIVGLVLLLA